MAAAALGLWLSAACRPVTRPPDVLSITIDTLRADRLGAYGSTLGLTPNLDRFAESATVFGNAFTAVPLTGPSLSTLFTSHYPHETRISDNGLRIPPEVPTLAGILRARGYETAAVVSNPVLTEPNRLDLNFESYDDALPDSNRGIPTRRGRATTDAALSVLRRRSSRPLFLWIHYMDPHGPYDAPIPFQEKAAAVTPAEDQSLPVNQTNRGLGGIPRYQYIEGCHSSRDYRVRYNAGVASLDDEIGRLLSSPEIASLSRSGLTVITADHGESLGDHGVWFAHGENVYSEMLRVPLLVSGARIRAGRRKDPVSLLDVLPSIRDYVGLEKGAERGLPVFMGPGANDRILFSETFPVAATSKRYTAYGSRGSAIYSEPGGWEYYEDRLQRADLGAGRPAGLRSLARRLLAEVARNELSTQVPVGPAVALSPESIRQLRSLGYLQ